MRILIVADVLGEENNGTTIACMNLIRYLKECGDDVRVLCCDKDKKDLANYFIVPVLNLGFIANYIFKKNSVVVAKPNKKIILKALEGVDIVHVMIPLALGNKTARIAKKMNIPVTAGFHAQAENVTAHLKLMNFQIANKLTYKIFYNKLYKYVDAIHYPTEFIKRVFEGSVKRRTNGYVISNGVNDRYRKMDVIRSDELKDTFNILFIGRYSREKSHAILIKAISKSKYKDKIQLVLAGKGPMANSIIKLSKKLGIRMPIMKFFSRDDLVKTINSCDLYVHPAEIEIEAISCLEAITCGLVPIISDSSRSATNAFALTPLNLFKNNSSTDLAEKIDYWIGHPKEKEECSKQYLGYTKEFEQSKCMENMRKMLLTYAKEEIHIPGKKYYYRDELHDDFAFNKIEVVKLNKPYKYVATNPLFRFAAFIAYNIIAKPIAWLMNKIVLHQHIENKSVLKRCKNTGYFIYANHTHGMGDAFTPNILTNKRNYMIVGPETISIKGLKGLVNMLGAIPIIRSTNDVEGFYDCINKRIKQKKSITIYPEAHIWPYYTHIRPFDKSSFRYPVDLNVPVFVITNTWQKRKIGKGIKLVSYLSGPYYPNNDLPRLEAMQELRDRVYNEMCRISKNSSQVEKVKYIKVSE